MQPVSMAGGLRRNYQRGASYIRGPRAWLSLVYPRPNTTAGWDGLRCGEAYLEAEEYVCTREWIERCGIRRRDEFLLELALQSEEFVRQFRVRQGIITEKPPNSISKSKESRYS